MSCQVLVQATGLAIVCSSLRHGRDAGLDVAFILVFRYDGSWPGTVSYAFRYVSF